MEVLLVFIYNKKLESIADIDHIYGWFQEYKEVLKKRYGIKK